MIHQGNSCFCASLHGREVGSWWTTNIFFLFLNPKLFYLLITQLWQLLCTSLFCSNQYFCNDVSIRDIGIYLADLFFQIQIIKRLKYRQGLWIFCWQNYFWIANVLYNWYLVSTRINLLRILLNLLWQDRQ